MFYIVYKIINKINKKSYIGVHSTDCMEDGYFGSGKLIKKAIKKYGKENFEKRVLKKFSSKDTAYSYERLLVNEDFIKSKNTYNLKLGGLGGFLDPKGSCYKGHETLKTKYGTVDFFLNSKSSKLKSLMNSKISRAVIGKGDCMYSCRTPDSLEKKRSSLIKKYGNLCGQMHTKESKSRSVNSKKKGSLKKLISDIPEFFRYIVIQDYLSKKIIWKGRLIYSNRNLDRYPNSSNYREVRIVYENIKGLCKKEYFTFRGTKLIATFE